MTLRGKALKWPRGRMRGMQHCCCSHGFHLSTHCLDVRFASEASCNHAGLPTVKDTERNTEPSPLSYNYALKMKKQNFVDQERAQGC